MDKKDRPLVEWERAVKVFSEGGLSLQIDRLPLGKPRFSLSYGVVREGREQGGFTSRIPARYAYERETNSVVFDDLPPPGAADRLFEQAKAWMRAEVCAIEARYEERQKSKQGANGTKR